MEINPKEKRQDAFEITADAALSDNVSDVTLFGRQPVEFETERDAESKLQAEEGLASLQKPHGLPKRIGQQHRAVVIAAEIDFLWRVGQFLITVFLEQMPVPAGALISIGASPSNSAISATDATLPI